MRFLLAALCVAGLSAGGSRADSSDIAEWASYWAYYYGYVAAQNTGNAAATNAMYYNYSGYYHCDLGNDDNTADDSSRHSLGSAFCRAGSQFAATAYSQTGNVNAYYSWYYAKVAEDFSNRAGDDDEIATGKAEGILASKTASSVTIRLDGGTLLTVTINSATKLERNDVQVSSTASFKVGQFAETLFNPSTKLASKVESYGP